jgi:hypothetical protein
MVDRGPCGKAVETLSPDPSPVSEANDGGHGADAEGFAAAAAHARFRGDGDAREGDEEDEPSDIHRTTREFPQSPQLRAALWGASAGLAVADRNRRGLGFRVAGLRRVEAQTGGNVSVRSALIGVLFDYPGDPQARQRAVMELYEVNDVNPLAGCGWSLAGPFVTQLVLALASPGGRTVRDRITGTGVIVDR